MNTILESRLYSGCQSIANYLLNTGCQAYATCLFYKQPVVETLEKNAPICVALGAIALMGWCYWSMSQKVSKVQADKDQVEYQCAGKVAGLQQQLVQNQSQPRVVAAAIETSAGIKAPLSFVTDKTQQTDPVVVPPSVSTERLRTLTAQLQEMRTDLGRFRREIENFQTELIALNVFDRHFKKFVEQAEVVEIPTSTQPGTGHNRSDSKCVLS